MKNRGSLVPVAIAVASGLTLWLITSALTGQREPWDSTTYWVAVYPAAIVISAILGYLYPERLWRWALLVFGSQFVAMCIGNGGLGNLWPLSVVLFTVIALPGIVAAKLASRLGRAFPGRKGA